MIDGSECYTPFGDSEEPPLAPGEAERAAARQELEVDSSGEEGTDSDDEDASSEDTRSADAIQTAAQDETLLRSLDSPWSSRSESEFSLAPSPMASPLSFREACPWDVTPRSCPWDVTAPCAVRPSELVADTLTPEREVRRGPPNGAALARARAARAGSSASLAGVREVPETPETRSSLVDLTDVVAEPLGGRPGDTAKECGGAAEAADGLAPAAPPSPARKRLSYAHSAWGDRT